MAHRKSSTPLRDKLLPGLKDRHDGWTEARLVRFMDVLAETGCVTDAARVAGISTVGVARNRRRFPAFADAMDEALDHAQRGLIAVAHRYATQGKETIIIRKGEEVERRIAPDSATLGLLIKRGNNGGIRDPDTGQFLTNAEAAARGLTKEVMDSKTITLAEWNEDWRFDADGKKYKGLPPKDGLNFMDRLIELRKRGEELAREGGLCQMCQQPLPCVMVDLLPNALPMGPFPWAKCSFLKNGFIGKIGMRLRQPRIKSGAEPDEAPSLDKRLPRIAGTPPALGAFFGGGDGGGRIVWA
jgi:hypothetical protein